ncbi:MBL fold metallo-hydrolase [Candidatus Viridilinea mediisalina]|uniref:MBL fold metallo-hydrolase n=1 Tax=Candidatus Viridilinea mediisalina TaxID=2024553 RepID=A0A2A6RJ38_9CHLR|nr:MBL fold metallo-hydrolase [Candidatus Viridilinea mediisalina]PDW03087.1 MBL fold metallo-hydrolase [Candidatus Viridilinea mediisalina]
MAEENITRFTTSNGIRIYRIPLRVFPSLWAYAHLVIAGDYLALVDVGSGQGSSDEQLRAGMAAIADEWDEAVSWADLNRIVITHAHIDHHGGLNMVRHLTDAPIAVHELDRRVLIKHDERLALTRFRLGVFLRRAGFDEAHRMRLLKMYSGGKHLFQSLPVQDVMRDGDLLDGLFRVIHVPGHCPGHVCLQLDNILLTADHVLPGVAIFLSPESLTASTGVDHFLQSLRKVAQVQGVELCLGGHDRPVQDVGAAIARIERTQQQRIQRIYEACAEPHSIASLTHKLYPSVGDYDELLAIQKVGAYLEYLDQRGMLEVANLEEVAEDERGVPRYRAV